jgi:hypothetical protein
VAQLRFTTLRHTFQNSKIVTLLLRMKYIFTSYMGFHDAETYIVRATSRDFSLKVNQLLQCLVFIDTYRYIHTCFPTVGGDNVAGGKNATTNLNLFLKFRSIHMITWYLVEYFKFSPSIFCNVKHTSSSYGCDWDNVCV